MSYCVTASEFFESFLPIPTDSRRMKPKPVGINFTKVQGFTSERDLAERWVAVVNNAKTLCAGYAVCLSQDRWDPADSNKLKVDAAIYPRRKHPTDGRPHWGRQRALVEFKKGGTDSDPFHDLLGDAQAQKPTEVRGQLASYSAYSFSRQQRTANFLFLINGTEARVTRWERAGTIFTEAFDYVQDPDLMCEFLWRFSMLTEEDQGLDPTAKLLGKNHKFFKLMDRIAESPLEGQPEDICEDEGTVISLPSTSSSGKTAPIGVFKYVREKFAASLEDDAPRYRLSVPTDRPGRFKYYLVGKPVFEASGMLGRGTRGYIAIDVHTKRFVWLKDTWRAYYVNVDPEGEILRKLQDQNVARIPTLLHAGDLQQETQMHYHCKPDSEVQDSGEASEGSRGSKRARSGTSKSSTDDKKQRKQPRVRHFSHYRIVVDEVCLRLNEFKTSRQLIQVVLDCVEAHEEAVTKAKLIHGDISFGNVLILPTLVEKDGQLVVEWRGILADWELSKPIPEDGKAARARQPERMGTWQFMSAALLTWLRMPIAVEDEVESFFYIIIYGGVRFLRSSVHEAAPFLRSFFDSVLLEKNQYRCGLVKWTSMLGGVISNGSGSTLRFSRNKKKEHPLNLIIADMLPLFKARYAVIDFKQERVKWRITNKLKNPGTEMELPASLDQSVIDSAAQLKTHAHFKALLRRLLAEESWPTEDYVGDLTLPRVAPVKNDDNAVDEDSSSDYDQSGDSSPTIKRAKLEADEDMAIFGELFETEEGKMNVDQGAGTSTSTSRRFAASRKSTRR
ncbi:hypothetical protein L226DRAFT_494709 [Lentinus tigrinus ALCF2SS1-7]|uniref:Fungal-type protein kinase domain-containing protein n=1 Tax=Lentinus tigrinus ALCF2SS1-6 TaxID=1328759 RepID=A0A5C2RX98_9APHY|nr:hypothetical protein L227DRAFT_554530 [Lentinus tigrinus ALCF2SS1-6]RPD69075.1 hypothetical protein L226DRAFT_494709 [Lentinus tigrinus ALCF2SS1-7]